VKPSRHFISQKGEKYSFWPGKHIWVNPSHAWMNLNTPKYLGGLHANKIAHPGAPATSEDSLSFESHSKTVKWLNTDRKTKLSDSSPEMRWMAPEQSGAKYLAPQKRGNRTDLSGNSQSQAEEMKPIGMTWSRVQNCVKPIWADRWPM
jgi:hypothetical protein